MKRVWIIACILTVPSCKTYSSRSTTAANDTVTIPSASINQTAKEFDLLLKGGRVIDPMRNMDAINDVAIKNGKIVRIDHDISASLAQKSVLVEGLLVLPGLIDTHVHVFHGTDPQGGLRNGFSAVAPDAFSFRSCVTTMVDAGSSGWRNFDTFKQQTIQHSQTRVLAFLNIVGHGMHGDESDQQDLNDMSAADTAKVAKANSDVIVGIKLAHFATNNWEPSLRAVEAATLANIKVMVDFGHSTPLLSLETLFLKIMRPGDIFTHMYGNTPGRMTIVDSSGNVQGFTRAARQRGILFDVGHGGGSFAFSQAAPAVKQGFYPDVISTDLHTGSMNSAMRDMLNVMGKMMSLGLTLNDVVRMTTKNAAEEINRPELGQLKIGGNADIAIVRPRNEPAGFYDVEGKRYTGNQSLECEMTLMGGRVVFDRNARTLGE